MTILPARPVLASLLTLVLAPTLVGLAPSAPASAAPLPAPYSASAHGDLVQLSASVAGASLADVRVGHSRATADSNPALSDNVVAESKNAEAAVDGFPISVDTASATAPPSENPPSQSLLGVSLAPIATVGAITGDVVANYTDANSCVPAVGSDRILGDSITDLAGLTLATVPGFGSLASVGASQMRATTRLIDDAVGGSDVVSTSTTSVGDVNLLGSAVQIDVSSPVTLRATSDGTTGSAGFVTPPTVSVTVAGVPSPIVIPLNGTPVDINVPGLPLADVTITGFNPNNTSSGATGSATLQSLLRVQVGILAVIGPPLASVDLSLVPMSVAATAPAGGVECTTPDVVAPDSPTIDDPTDGDTVTDRTPTISGSGAEPGSTVTVYGTDGTTVLCIDETVGADGLWSCEPEDELPLGDQTVTATSTDEAGNESDASAPVDFTIEASPDTTAPDAPVILLPVGGAAIDDATPTVSGTAEANSTVLVTEDGVEICTAETNPVGVWACTPTTPLAEGEHTFDAVAEDAAGNKSTADSVTFTINDTTAPDAPVITAPADGEGTDDPTPTVTGTAEPGSTVTVTEDGATICTAQADTQGDWSCTPTTALAEGEHTFDAVAEDEAGNQSPADSVTFTVNDTTAPDAPVILVPVGGVPTTDTTPLVSGTAEPDSTVTVTENGVEICTTEANGVGVWSCSPPDALPLGEHTFEAVAEDEAGNTSEADSVTFTIIGPPGDTTPPNAPVITTPAEGSSTADTTPTISGTAEAGSTVRVTEGGTLICTTQTNAQGAWACTPTTALSIGQHSISATATDEAGNTSAAASTTFKVIAGGTDDDGDGLPLEDETANGTDPTKADTDGDGLTDGTEVNTTKTDPLDPDTDNDGLTDGLEVNGMVIKEQFEVCGKKATKQIRVVTNPLAKDTDKDGLTDGKEVKGYTIKQRVMITRSGKSIVIGKTRSNPTKADTDKDGLMDKAEVTGSKNKKFGRHKTDPSKCDTDRGGVGDGKEVRAGSDPSQIKSGPNDLESRMANRRGGTIG